MCLNAWENYCQLLVYKFLKLYIFLIGLTLTKKWVGFFFFFFISCISKFLSTWINVLFSSHSIPSLNVSKCCLCFDAVFSQVLSHIVIWGQFLWEKLVAAPAPARRKLEIQPASTSTPGNKRATNPAASSAQFRGSDGSQHFPTGAGLSKNTRAVGNAWHTTP